MQHLRGDNYNNNKCKKKKIKNFETTSERFAPLVTAHLQHWGSLLVRKRKHRPPSLGREVRVGGRVRWIQPDLSVNMRPFRTGAPKQNKRTQTSRQLDE